MKVSQQRLADKKIYQNVPIQQRSNFRKKVLQTKQIKGQQPKFFVKHYPNSQFFQYNGVKLNYHCLQEHKKPKAILFFHHGMYFHANGSGYLADIVSKNSQTNVYALDFKNAGKSQGGCPGYYQSVQSLIDQAQNFMQLILKKYQTKPKIFIAGQSMGGLVTFKLCLKNPQKYAGAILLCPALRDCYQTIPFLKKVGRVLGYLFPTWKLVPQDLSDMKMNRYENFEYIQKDEGRYLGKHPPGSAACLLKELDSLSDHFKQMMTPYLCIQAGVQMAVDLFAPLDLQKQAPVKDKTTIYYKQMWHDILIQQEIQQISPIITGWIKQRS